MEGKEILGAASPEQAVPSGRTFSLALVLGRSLDWHIKKLTFHLRTRTLLEGVHQGVHLLRWLQPPRSSSPSRASILSLPRDLLDAFEESGDVANPAPRGSAARQQSERAAKAEVAKRSNIGGDQCAPKVASRRPERTHRR